MSANSKMPVVWLVGDVDHPEFGVATALMQATATLVRFADAAEVARDSIRSEARPDVIVWATSRPGINRARGVELLRGRAPLAGMVALLGSWCEGETRTGRPVSGVVRLFWYDFPNWWRRQIALLESGNCPDWAQPATAEANNLGTQKSLRIRGGFNGLILLQTTCWETGDVLADVLRRRGYATAWNRPGGHHASVRGAAAGIWEGRQLDEPEVIQLSAFCRRLAKDGAPVIALADFPRRDRCEVATRAGAAVVMGKPWLNADLLAALERLMHEQTRSESRVITKRAA